MASYRKGVRLLTLPTSLVEARKRLMDPCRVLRRQHHLENPAAPEVCRVTIAGHRRGDRSAPGRSVTMTDPFPRECACRIGRGLVRWKAALREMPERDTTRGGFDS